MNAPIDRIPPLAAWTEDVAGVERRFTPFAHGSAPDPDQPGVRAMNAAAALEAVQIAGTWPRRLALPLAALVAGATAAALHRLASGVQSLDGPPLAAAAGALAGTLVLAAVRQRCVWRHRGYAARNAMLTLGRCGACGFLLRGATRRIATDRAATAGDATAGDAIELCVCGECGSLWPALASEHPKRSDTGERVDLPEVTGVDALRTRLRLRRALHARPSDFLRDDAGEPRYIAHMDGAHRRGALALARDLFDAFAALVMGVVVAGVLLCCAGTCVFGMLDAVVAIDRSDAALASAAFGVEVAIALVLVALGLAACGGLLTQRHRAAQGRRFLRHAECPCCTMNLPMPEPDSGLSRCTCCTAAWRR